MPNLTRFAGHCLPTCLLFRAKKQCVWDISQCCLYYIYIYIWLYMIICIYIYDYICIIYTHTVLCSTSCHSYHHVVHWFNHHFFVWRRHPHPVVPSRGFSPRFSVCKAWSDHHFSWIKYDKIMINALFMHHVSIIFPWVFMMFHYFPITLNDFPTIYHSSLYQE